MKMSNKLGGGNKKYLYKISGVAIANKKYRWGINIIEKYNKRYTLTENEKYKLGLLYDHLAMKIKKLKMKEKQKKYLIDKYLTKAKILYKEILKKNPRYFHALYGIGRIYSIYGNYDKALSYQIRVYKQMVKLPKNQRGALAIGHLYKLKKDYKKAEKWYLREYKSCRKNDFGTTFNLFSFYKETKNYKKALFYGLKTEQLLKKEFKKDIYKGLKIKNSDFFKYVEREIKNIKSLSKKRNRGL